MWRYILFVLPLLLCTTAIRVPVEGKDEKLTKETPTENDEKKHEAYYVADDANIDSYLIPPDTHRPVEVLPDVIVTPATHLLPPSPEKQINYYVPTEAGEQSDWYPIVQSPLPAQVSSLPQRPLDSVPIILPENDTFTHKQNYRGGKSHQGDRMVISVPSRELEPPLENAANQYVIEVPSIDLELPSEEISHQFISPINIVDNAHVIKPYLKTKSKKPLLRLKNVDPTLSIHLTPPKPQKYRNPTKLYPKKATTEFKPIPIPISEFAEESSEIPRAKPLKQFNPGPSDETEYFSPEEEKKIYLYEQAEQKRKLAEVKEPVGINEQQLASTEDAYGDNVPAEQETSETNYRHPGRNAYPAPLRQEPPTLPTQSNSAIPAGNGKRTEFRMHGMKGPHSYQFGFDTGKGKNRQFRFEERDNDGRVKGHYGYMDNDGKLRVVNYGADPEHGFHADSPKEQEQ